MIIAWQCFIEKRYLNGLLIYKVYAYCQAYHVNQGNSCSRYPAGNKIEWKSLPEQIK
jgi:hypothetical protein